MLGTGNALETLCGQAYGAKQYQMLGIHMQRGMLVLLAISISISIIWAFAGHIFAFCGQDMEVSVHVGLYARWFASSCKETWTGFSKEGARNLLSFLSLAIPSALMVCLEQWAYEFLVFMSGLLPNPKLETSIMAISISSQVFRIPFGFGSAVSTRVSKELGAGKPNAAKLAACDVLLLAVVEGLLLSGIAVAARTVWGHIYTNEDEVVKYLSTIMPVLALSNFMDGIQEVLSGLNSKQSN
ncbi:hypothetical protein RDI58_008550 [Solanum bulbocastanum]|uniref:Uncharacterized protein n=1 Tax=Solanum bulbocastanum TaxID=147425 RepID=A0AAN8U3L8_SOLBU